MRSGQYVRPCNHVATGPEDVHPVGDQLPVYDPLTHPWNALAPRDPGAAAARRRSRRLGSLAVADAQRDEHQRVRDVARVEGVVARSGLPFPRVKRR